MFHISGGKHHRGTGKKNNEIGLANTGNHSKSLKVDIVYSLIGMVSVEWGMVSNMSAPEPAISCLVVRRRMGKKPCVARVE
jgi:hypothetical protein